VGTVSLYRRCRAPCVDLDAHASDLRLGLPVERAAGLPRHTGAIIGAAWIPAATVPSVADLDGSSLVSQRGERVGPRAGAPAAAATGRRRSGLRCFRLLGDARMLLGRDRAGSRNHRGGFWLLPPVGGQAATGGRGGFRADHPGDPAVSRAEFDRPGLRHPRAQLFEVFSPERSRRGGFSAACGREQSAVSAFGHLTIRLAPSPWRA